ncbi:MAG: PaaI family thioesterase [Candidatus Anaerobiospirillum merdipullorum]|uniref:PaaI family thioesterase n=1 Tax=Candidatus Anaerobiospirillum merdipullorum TaxID=2838450 RepID=A0A9E2NS95_9GAMM|nr:PaaI family thioesterase [Candidatus Anaerobiospirillum merdipullorum]
MTAPLSSAMHDFLSISVQEISATHLVATMPVTERTCQPCGLLCGGASLALAEICAGMYSQHLLQGSDEMALGIQVNGHHLHVAHLGEIVSCEITPLSCGKTLHVLQAKISNASGTLVCEATITNLIRPQPHDS